ncbi:MAG: asparaginase [Eikenella sp.]|nr:asparaginase [Eikenella sp.]
MKRIFVLYTGGTIGMRQTPSGLAPDTALVETALTPFGRRARFHWHVCRPLIDSAALSPAHWAEWLQILGHALPDCDGILLLHGTDTLAYTANLLALAFDNRHKPVVLTGSQRPYSQTGSDAPHNLHTAVSALLRHDVHETLIAFNGQLFPAVGSSKCSTETAAGFDNPHFGSWQPGRPAASLDPLPKRFDPHACVGHHRLVPGCNSTMIAHNLSHFPQQAAVLHSYGHGNAPDDEALLAAVRRFTEERLLLNISQVPHGRADGSYAQSSPLSAAGATAGGRCNTETATVLMMLAAANRWQKADLRQALQQLGLL